MLSPRMGLFVWFGLFSTSFTSIPGTPPNQLFFAKLSPTWWTTFGSKKAIFSPRQRVSSQDGGKPLQIQIPLLKAHHDAAFGKGAIRKSTVNNFGPIFTNVLLKGGGHAIVDRVLSWPTFTSPRTGRKQKGTPIRLQCTHRYCKPFRGAVLKSCTFCGC